MIIEERYLRVYSWCDVCKAVFFCMKFSLFPTLNSININPFLLYHRSTFVLDLKSPWWSFSWQFLCLFFSPYALKKSIPKRNHQRKERGKRSSISARRMFFTFLFKYLCIMEHMLIVLLVFHARCGKQGRWVLQIPHEMFRLIAKIVKW